MCCGGSPGGLLYVFEKLASFVALTAVIMCILVTMFITLGLGIGLGYNYCFVDLKVVTEPSANSEEPPALRATTNKDEGRLEANTPSYRRSPATLPPTAPRRTLPMPGIKHTMAIPLHGDFDFPSLIAKLRGRNRNVTLELIT